MASDRYRHTQIGWVTLVALGASAVLVGVILALTRLWGPLALVSVVLLVPAALFATLTIEVDDRHLTFRFGVGLIRKRIALADIRHFSIVRNPWWYGWGIHFTPSGVLYNVSGLEAVQLHLRNGKSLRLGTDEPQALCRALEHVLGPAQPLSATEAAQVKRQARWVWAILVAIACVILAFVGGVFYFHEQPPEVTLTADHVRVTNALYGAELPFGEITHLSLEQRLPRIRLRTNGYAAGGTLRGHFRLDQLGDGQLFIEAGHPPYILIRRGPEYVIVNFADPAATTELYRQLEARWQTARTR